MTFDEKEQLRTELTAAYEKTPPDEQIVLQITSVFYVYLDKARLIQALRESPAAPAPDLLTRPSTVDALLKGLCDKRLLERHPHFGYRCNELIVEQVARAAVKQGHFSGIVRFVRGHREKSWQYFVPEMRLQELRIAVYLREGGEKIKTILSEISHYTAGSVNADHPFIRIFNNPFDRATVSSLQPELQAEVLMRILMYAALKLEPAETAVSCARDFVSTGEAGADQVRYCLAQYLTLQGKLAEAEQVLGEANVLAGAEAMRACLLFLRGRDGEALTLYEAAYNKLKKETKRNSIAFRGVYGVFYPLLLIASKDPVLGKRAAQYIGHAERGEEYGDIQSILGFFSNYWIFSQNGGALPPMSPALPPGASLVLKDFFRAIVSYYMHPPALKSARKELAAFLDQAKGHGFSLVAAELNELLSRMNDKNKGCGAEAAAFRQASGTRSLLDLIAPEERWERSLAALKSLTMLATAEAHEKRLVWLFRQNKNGQCQVQPKEQKRTAKGWSSGKALTLQDLQRDATRSKHYTDQDRRLIYRLLQDNPYWGYYAEFGLESMAELAGHPLVFLADSPGVRVELVKGEPSLIVTRDKSGILIALHPDCGGEERTAVIRETPVRFRLVEITERHKALAKIIGTGLSVPLSASGKALEAISAVSSLVQVQSDLDGSMENIPEIPSEPCPHVVLMPFQEGLKVQVLARPFSGKGPYFQPGKGGETVIAEIDGERVQTRRSLEQERILARETLQACAILEQYEDIDGEWLLDTPEASLELLTELRELGEKARVDWPEGAKFKITGHLSFDGFRMAIRRENDWFTLNGEASLDEGKVMELRQLLELLDAAPGRFLPLGNGEFLALTREFRKRLDDLASLSERHAKGVRFHPLAASAIEELTAGTDLETDRQWKEQIARIEGARALQPVVPSTLQAELRDYQAEGFAWLARLAHWGVGACLADDMGLGKTIQALALIISRAAKGPALVVAPTSVCMNWLEEAKRFAPTLRAFQFGPGDRKETIASLKPFDLMVCSYGLLQQEEELLTSLEWETIVLDEAQAIKNSGTQRSQAAMKLQGRFKIITTGTPVENHLDELWNLFRFINPGLLGSLDAFHGKFANPIERDKDHQARARLKRLVQPFILRRLKAQVLTELPQKTEIILHVELSGEEAALYEAMRRQSIDRIARAEGNIGQKSIQILAEIMRLRRLCCNPRLVLPDTTAKSSKFELFTETLEELLENKHKALIFSQFVDHLKIMREFLEEKKIPYQYIDGSTPPRERKRAVDAFQSGDGDVFLISLKAGGLGLNLTAADYVLHMDPWWNPAVEDQASDRAYRIGQNRPVTIYRLITKGTIEEKIVDLHKHKRALADSLLEGSDMCGRISPDELLQLLVEPARA